MKINNKNILVTGAGGFIGSHLTERLIGMGNDVTAFIRYNSRNSYGMLEMIPEKLRRDLTIVQGDLRDGDALRSAMKGKDVVFHLGALIAIPYSYVNPREVIETNVIGTFNVMTAARDMGVKKIVHTSTSEVYGTARYVPIDESHPLQGQSPYSASKIGADKIAESFHLSYELPVATIRPFNTYGPRQSARSVIPTIITQALLGKVIDLGSLKPRRDFTYVSDTVNGFIKVAEKDASIGGVFNIGSNFDISIKDLVREISDVIGKKIVVRSDKDRVRPDGSEVMRLLADNSRAKKILGWKNAVPIKDGLKMTAEWIEKNQYFYKRGYTL